MKIGICDDGIYSLQDKLLSEGHTLCILLPGYPNKGTSINMTKQKSRIHSVNTLGQFIDEDCDLYLIVQNEDSDNVYDALKSLGKLVIGASKASAMLEHDREFARRVTELKVAELAVTDSREFNDMLAACEYISRQTSDLVVKNGSRVKDPMHTSRTTFVPQGLTPPQARKFIKKVRAWRAEGGGISLTVEPIISGTEMCYGAWFNGTEFLLDHIYLHEELKDISDNGSGILRDECGATMKFIPLSKESKVYKIFKDLEPLLAATGYSGTFSFNAILTRDKLVLLEYTARFGRPTLDILISLLKEKANLAGFLLCLAHGKSPIISDWFNVDNYALGTVVFPCVAKAPYNYLWQIQGIKLPNLPNLPSPSTGGSTEIIPYGMIWDGEKYVLSFSSGLFMLLSLNKSLKDAIKDNQSILKNYTLLGATWRSNVGLTFDNSCKRLVSNQII